MLTLGEMLLHDNALPHIAARILALLEHFNWGLFDHIFYSPDLAPSDYHLLTYLKNSSSGRGGKSIHFFVLMALSIYIICDVK
jgi:hypothetical protein